MTAEQCDVCKFAPPAGSYSTCSGDDLPVWDCGMLSDPRMPDTMEDDTLCPCFVMDDRYKVDIYGDSYCPYCGGNLIEDKNIESYMGQDGVGYFEDELVCEICNRRYHREYSTHVEIDDVELTEMKEE